MSSNAIRKPCQSRLRRARGLAAALGLCMLMGCGGTGSGGADAGIGDDCLGDRASVEVGQGGARLAPLVAGGDLFIVEGSQGGIHVLVGFFLGGAPRDVTAVYRLTEGDTNVVMPLERELRPGLFDAQDGRTVRNPDLLILNNESPDPSSFEDRAVRLRIDVTEADGSHHCDARDVFLRVGSP